MSTRCRAASVVATPTTLLILAASDHARAGAGPALISVELRPASQTVAVGDNVDIGLYLVASGPGQSIAAAEIILNWNPAELQLVGLDQTGAVSLLSSSFPVPDPYTLNDAMPPADGDALYVALAGFGSPTVVSETGTLLTTVQFQALAPAPASPVDIAETGGSPEGETVVFDGTVPNLDVTGALSGAVVEITSTCAADLDGDGAVGSSDLAILLGDWGSTGTPSDFDGGGVASSDLAILLGNWGPCPGTK